MKMGTKTHIILAAAAALAASACSKRAADHPETAEGTEGAAAEVAQEGGAGESDEGPPGSEDAASGGAAADAGPWQELEASACLDAYAKCLESLPEDRKDKLWLPYEQLQRGIEMLREMEPAEVGPSCNGTMSMFRNSQLC